MTRSLWLMSAAIIGCGQTKESIATVDSSEPDEIELPQNLNGVAPDQDIPPPVFTAYNYDGNMRSQADLIGHPTVMWFFPFAGTPG